MAYGQSERPMLSFFHNGNLLSENSVQRIRGLVYPAASGASNRILSPIFYRDHVCFSCVPPVAVLLCVVAAAVADGATLEANFTHSFTHPAPSGYTGIIVATDMI